MGETHLEAAEVPVVRRHLRSQPRETLPELDAVAPWEKLTAHQALGKHVPAHEPNPAAAHTLSAAHRRPAAGKHVAVRIGGRPTCSSLLLFLLAGLPSGGTFPPLALNLLKLVGHP